MNRLRCLSAALTLCTILLPGAARPARQQTLAEADRHYDEKSYGAALEGYRSLEKAGAVPSLRRDEIGYRITVCLGKTKKWDEALKSSLDFVKAHRGTVWEPRELYWLARLYAGIDHEGYR